MRKMFAITIGQDFNIFEFISYSSEANEFRKLLIKLDISSLLVGIKYKLLGLQLTFDNITFIGDSRQFCIVVL